ncbi:MAG: hemerythrin domain-containing protein [Rhodospirillaceae bacterium]
MEWTEELSVGHGGIDEQHRQLIASVNALNAAFTDLAAGDGGDLALARISAAAAAFLASFQSHTAYEELIMHQFFYAHVERHAVHHATYLEALTTLLAGEPVAAAVRVNLPFINSAVFDHIERDDRDFGAHLRSIGLYGRV